MDFVDRAKVILVAGDGGDGCLAFRREKFVPRGGPSGGDGGDGGSIYFHSTTHLNTLLPFRFKQRLKAGRGEHGSGNKKHGRDGKDLTTDVPVGTQVLEEETRKVLHDFDEPDQLFLAARGGRGGRGNAAFATSTNQAPRRIEKGQPGEKKTVILELKILADVGLIGLPNAGKSTLISALSSARPKVAGYPFTTLSPHLGVVSLDDFSTFVMADIPGLIKGAHGGSGLGDDFLRHVERCHLLAHLVDVSGLGADDPVEAFETVNRELALYDEALSQKPQIVVASKMDAVEADKAHRLEEYSRQKGLLYFEVSAAQRSGLEKLKRKLVELLK